MASGLAALRRKQAMQARKAELGKELAAETSAAMASAMTEFKENLERFALKHREEIRSDPEFRAHFHSMCAHVGVDPLASNKAKVNQLLNFDNWSFARFYYELGVSVVEVCMATRPSNGGLIELQKLTKLVRRRRGSAVNEVSEDDVMQAVRTLKVLDNSFTVLPDPSKLRSHKGVTFYVSSVPRETGKGLQDILDAAREEGGFVSVASLSLRPSWGVRRAELALQNAVQEGTCMVDDGDESGKRLYWFPVLSVMDE